MAVTENLYTGDGSTVLFSFSFSYLSRSEVIVTLNGSPTTAFTFPTASQIQFTTAPATGVAIRIYRETDIDTAKATFVQGSAIRAADLNNNFTQIRNATQESRNNSWKVLDDETTYSTAGWVSTDDKIPTVAAVEERLQELIEDNSVLPSDAADVSFVQAGTGATARTVNDKLQDFVSVKDFGAVGNSTTDDTAAIQAALDSLSATGGVVYMPPGRYRVSSMLTIPAYVKLTGSTRSDGSSSAYATRIQCVSSVTCVKLGGNKSAIENLTIRYTVTPSSGQAILAEDVADPLISFVYIVGAFNGITLTACNTPVVQYTDVIDCVGSYGYKIQGDAVMGNSDSHLLVGVSGGFTGSGPSGFTHLLLDNYTNSGKVIGYRFVKGDYGVRAINTTDDPDDCWFQAGGCDNQVVNGYRFESGQNIYLTDVWCGQAGANGIYLGPNFTGNLVASGLRIRGSVNNGLLIEGGKVIHITNPLIGQNGDGTTNTFSGIKVNAAIQKLSVIGGTCGLLEAGGTNHQKDGIDLSNASVDNVSIVGVNLQGNITRAFTTSANTKDIFVDNCPGYSQIDGYFTLRLSGAVADGSYDLALIGGLERVLIKTVVRKLSSGTCDVRLRDNGGNGMAAAVGTTSTAQSTTLATPVEVNSGAGPRHLTVDVSSAAAANDLLVTFGYQRLVRND